MSQSGEIETVETGGAVLGPGRGRLLRGGALVGLWAAVVLGSLIMSAALAHRADKLDFNIYYTTALATRLGINPYTTDLSKLGQSVGFDLGKIVRCNEPPTFLLFFEPLTLLSPTAAFWVWTWISVISFLLALILIVHWTPGLSTYAAWVIAAIAILSPSVLEHLLFSQSKMVILLMLVLTLRWLEEGRDAAAGLMLAFASLLRGYPVLIAGYLLLTGRRRALAYTVVGLAAGGLASVALIGFTRSMGFMLAPKYLTEQWRMALAGNIALAPSVSRMFWYFFGAKLSFGQEWARRLLAWAMQAGLFALTAVVTLKHSSRDDPDGRLFSLWIMAAILIPPTAWLYDLVLLTIPMVRMTAAALHGRASRRAVWAGIVTYVVAWFYFTGVAMRGAELAAHGSSLLLSIGDFPVGVLAYLALYWFATDPMPYIRDETAVVGATSEAQAGGVT